MMGNRQSYNPPAHDLNGPLFGGHYAGDFSIRKGRPNVNKALPATPPPSKSVRFGAAPPAWEFYKTEAPEDNTANTRYLSPTTSSSDPHSSVNSRTTVYASPANGSGGFYVVNK